MKITEITGYLESIAPASLQEHYDNAGLLCGDGNWDCKGVMLSLDATYDVIQEAIDTECNLVISHHPIIFGGLKRLTGKNYVEKALINAIRNDIAIYAIHTNLDNTLEGVNGKIASLLGLENRTSLQPRENALRKLFTFIPLEHAEKVRSAIFSAGAGHIGNYSECSFSISGTGTFRAEEGTKPFVGEKGKRHEENEIKFEVVFPYYLQEAVVEALLKTHPYEEVAYDIVSLANRYPNIGSGLVGNLPGPLDEKAFLQKLKDIFGIPVIRHTGLTSKMIQRVALCGGAGSFLISKALSAGADVYVTADMKYHEFFDANGQILIADIGHFESEQFTINLLQEILLQKFPTFAVLKTTINTNPVRYF